MRRQAEGRRRHTAAEWERLVRAWKRSGLSARQFAESASVAPSTLAWWQWRLANPAAARSRATDEVGLVRVDVDGAGPGVLDGPVWELCAPSGCTLRVLGRLETSDVNAVVEAFVRAAVRT